MFGIVLQAFPFIYVSYTGIQTLFWGNETRLPFLAEPGTLTFSAPGSFKFHDLIMILLNSYPRRLIIRNMSDNSFSTQIDPHFIIAFLSVQDQVIESLVEALFRF